jgi:heme-degrading monooxygenase HmoA
MTGHCIEVVVYKVKNAETAEAARRAMKPHVAGFPGFLGWHAVTSADDKSVFTDIVTWRSLAEARAAGEKVMSDPECAPLMSEVAELISMGHYV